MSDDAGGQRGRETMSMTEAAELVGVSVDKVRRYIDEQEASGNPVAARDRDEQGQPRGGAWRHPYRDAMQAWRDRRRGLVSNGAGNGPGGDLRPPV